MRPTQFCAYPGSTAAPSSAVSPVQSIASTRWFVQWCCMRFWAAVLCHATAWTQPRIIRADVQPGWKCLPPWTHNINAGEPQSIHERASCSSGGPSWRSRFSCYAAKTVFECFAECLVRFRCWLSSIFWESQPFRRQLHRVLWRVLYERSAAMRTIELQHKRRRHRIQQSQ